MRLVSLKVAQGPLLLLLAACVAACATTMAADAPSPPTAAASAPAATASAAPSAQTGDAPSKAECDAFMDVIARTTTLRASIHRDPSTADRAQDWATRTAELAGAAKALRLAQADLVIESANLATRMGDLAKDLQALVKAEKAHDPAAITAAHTRVIRTSEQVEVITREPAARCSGDTLLLKPVRGRLSATAVDAVMRKSLPTFRKCYEDALPRDPKLQGRVVVSFEIGVEGKVTAAHDATAEPIPDDAIAPPSASTLLPMQDKKVSECVVSSALKLEFPKPDGGTVTVVYPFAFARTDK